MRGRWSKSVNRVKSKSRLKYRKIQQNAPFVQCSAILHRKRTNFSGILRKWANSLFFPELCGALAKNPDERLFYVCRTLSFPTVGFFGDIPHFERLGVENGRNRENCRNRHKSRIPDFYHIRRRISRGGGCPRKIRRREMEGFETHKKVSHPDFWLRPHRIHQKIMNSPIFAKIH